MNTRKRIGMVALCALLAALLCACEAKPQNQDVYASVVAHVMPVNAQAASALRPMEEAAFAQLLHSVGIIGGTSTVYRAGLCLPSDVAGNTLAELDANFHAMLTEGEAGGSVEVPISISRVGPSWNYVLGQVDAQSLQRQLWQAYAAQTGLSTLLYDYLFAPEAHDHTLNLLLSAAPSWQIGGETVQDVQRLYGELDALRALFQSVRELHVRAGDEGLWLEFTAADYPALLQQKQDHYASFDVQRTRMQAYTWLCEPLQGEYPTKQYQFLLQSMHLSDPADAALPMMLRELCTEAMTALDTYAAMGPAYCESQYPAEQPFPQRDIGYVPQNLRWVSMATVKAAEAKDCVFFLYDAQDTLYARGYLPAGESVQVRLMEGSYTLRFAQGDRWMGEDYFFGTEGGYFCLPNALHAQSFTAYDITLQQNAADTQIISYGQLRDIASKHLPVHPLGAEGAQQ